MMSFSQGTNKGFFNARPNSDRAAMRMTRVWWLKPSAKNWAVSVKISWTMVEVFQHKKNGAFPSSLTHHSFSYDLSHSIQRCRKLPKGQRSKSRTAGEQSAEDALNWAWLFKEPERA